MKKILFVDDDRRYAEPFVERAFLEFNIVLEHHQNWEEALSLLDDNFDDYDAVIIDGKGQRTKDSKGDDPGHVIQALTDLSERAGKGKYIPYAILSKYHELKEMFIEKPFFEKNSEEEALFEYLTNKINNSVDEKIKIKYSDVFECFGGKYLPIESSEKLLNVLQQIENNTWSSDSFNPLRKIIEAIYKKLHEIDDELIPYTCMNFDRGSVNFEYCARRLSSGKDIRDRKGDIIIKAIPAVVPEHLGWLIQPLDKVSSICSHDYKSVEFVNIYSLKTVVYGVMEMILWFRKYIDETYK